MTGIKTDFIGEFIELKGYDPTIKNDFVINERGTKQATDDPKFVFRIKQDGHIVADAVIEQQIILFFHRYAHKKSFKRASRTRITTNKITIVAMAIMNNIPISRMNDFIAQWLI